MNHNPPFEPRIPNAATRKAIKDAKAGRTIKGFKKAEDMLKSLKA